MGIKKISYALRALFFFNIGWTTVLALGSIFSVYANWNQLMDPNRDWVNKYWLMNNILAVISSAFLIKIFLLALSLIQNFKSEMMREAQFLAQLKWIKNLFLAIFVLNVLMVILRSLGTLPSEQWGKFWIEIAFRRKIWNGSSPEAADKLMQAILWICDFLTIHLSGVGAVLFFLLLSGIEKLVGTNRQLQTDLETVI